MAVIQISPITRFNINTYQALTTDAVEDYPTDCSAGSVMIIISEVELLVKGFKYFTGTNWIDL